MPTTDDVQKLLQGFLDFYDVLANSKARFIPPGQRTFHRARNFAIEIVKIDNHSQRRFSINTMAEQGGIVFAQNMAGHKDPKTTQIYQQLTPGYLRQQQDRVGVVRGVLVSNRAEKNKRLKL